MKSQVVLSRCLLAVVILALIRSEAGALESEISIRGYYMTFMRMPTFGLPQWKQMIDCMADDGANTLLLWTAGGFRSKKFPITWAYNRTHNNVEADFVRELIEYAHSKRIQVLLCFTPFAYDGVNQYPIDHPELKARQKSGEPAQYWGMHSWGYNLCPSQAASQRFMLEYVREMLFDFYPNADGLLIESSDYAICYCPDCGAKYFDREFQFVRQISDEVWRAKPKARIVVYPHYFSNHTVPGFNVPGANHEFDTRWTLFFTPHSAHVDTNLIARAKDSIYSDAVSLGSASRVRDGVRLAQKYRLSGYLPSLEPMTCPPGPPEKPGATLKPFHFGWLKDGEMPLNELPVRVNRIAYREYTRNPELREEQFRDVLGREIFGRSATAQKIRDLLELQETWFTEADWFAPGIYLAPERLKARAGKDKWPPERLKPYRERVEVLRRMEGRYGNSTNSGEREITRICDYIVSKWDAAQVFK